jgi:hypothetical protein
MVSPETGGDERPGLVRSRGGSATWSRFFNAGVLIATYLPCRSPRVAGVAAWDAGGTIERRPSGSRFPPFDPFREACARTITRSWHRHPQSALARCGACAGNSDSVTPSAPATFERFSKLMFFSPRSIWPMYVRRSPLMWANSSWDHFLAARRSWIRLPKSTSSSFTYQESGSFGLLGATADR